MQRAADEAGSPGRLVLRRGPDGEPFVTDGGHFILDCHLSVIPDPAGLGERLFAVPGVVEHGLFIGIARAIVTERDGAVEVIERSVGKRVGGP